MAETIIAWTDWTFNPWMGCQKISPGCKNCYAADLTEKRMGLRVFGPEAPRQITSAAYWRQPLQWQREAEAAGLSRRVFCGSLCDVFEDRPELAEPRRRLFELIRQTPGLDWQLLTKRPQNISTMLPTDWGDGWPNVWLGTSIESAEQAWRADYLRAIPAVIRFISYEPALGPLAQSLNLAGIHWVIYGGESGPHFRPEDKQWARDMRAVCMSAGVAFFHKQSAARFTERGIELDGEIVRSYPMERRVLAPARNPRNAGALWPPQPGPAL